MARGDVAFIKRRLHPKRFVYASANGKRLNREPRPMLYRLPELIAAPVMKPVFVVEGEKDADCLASLGAVVTTNSDGGGKRKWQRTYNRHFKGRRVVILPNNDAVGEAHAKDVAANLHGTARSVRIVDLPDLPSKGDISDWVAAGGTLKQLRALVSAADEYRPVIELLRPLPYDKHSEWHWMRHRQLESILRAELSPTEKIVMVAIAAEIVSPRLTQQPTQQTIARAVGISAGQCKRVLRSLRDRGYIRTTRQGRQNVYELLAG
jgi:DNA primase